MPVTIMPQEVKSSANSVNNSLKWNYPTDAQREMDGDDPIQKPRDAGRVYPAETVTALLPLAPRRFREGFEAMLLGTKIRCNMCRSSGF